MLNEVRLIGYLGRDPEGFDTRNGKGAKMSIATSRKFKRDGGEYEEETEWSRIVVFGKSAEFVLNYLGKGRLVCIRGRLKTSKYEKEGQTHYATDIIADNYGGVIALGRGDGEARGGGTEDYKDVKGDDQKTFSDDADDVPF